MIPSTGRLAGVNLQRVFPVDEVLRVGVLGRFLGRLGGNRWLGGLRAYRICGRIWIGHLNLLSVFVSLETG
jgi:hypothetical protein